MTSIVWVTQSNMKKQPDGSWQPKFDLSAAKSYGIIEFVFGHGNIALMNEIARETARRKLDTFDEAEDYLLLLGDNALNGHVFRVLFEDLKVGPVRVLRFDAAAKRYDVVTV